jgi:hypothetical protein
MYDVCKLPRTRDVVDYVRKNARTDRLLSSPSREPSDE